MKSHQAEAKIELGWPSPLRWLVIAAATIILCSCQAPRIRPQPTTSTAADIGQPPGNRFPVSRRQSPPCPPLSSSAPAIGYAIPPATGMIRETESANPSQAAEVIIGDSLPLGSIASVDYQVVTPPLTYDDATTQINGEAVIPTVTDNIQANPYVGNGFNGYSCGPFEVGPNTRLPWAPPGVRGPWPPDEYLCDGGDQQTLAKVGRDWTVYGLEPEDAVLHFDTLDGRTVIEPTNRVCVYAPRFAAVRKLTGLEQNERHLRMAALGERTPVSQHDDWQRATDVNQPVATVREVGTKLANILEDQNRGVPLDNAQALIQLNGGLLPYEDFEVIREGTLDRSEEARFAESVQAAVVWTHNLAVQLIIDGQSAEVVTSDARPQLTYQYELQGKPRMRVCKLASTGDAKPGEFVDFTIRFDNIGTQLVGNVTIVDNLTTRLEYVPDTQQCTLAATFAAQQNEGESLVLRWEITDPIEPGKGGVIRFRCRVR